MAEKKAKGRPKGTFKEKTKEIKYFGYRYTVEEVEEIKSILTRYKEKHKYKTTEAIFEIFRKIEEIDLK